MATVTLQGNTFNTNGELPAVGSAAPDFHLVDGKLDDVRLADYRGKKVILNIVPSLDTPTCAISTKMFNEKAGSRDDVLVRWYPLICHLRRAVFAPPRVSATSRRCR